MANEKNINSRIVHKHDTEANWNKATNFSPKQGELIVYDIDENYDYQRIKIGDGVTNVNELPFWDKGIEDKLIENAPNLEANRGEPGYIANRPGYRRINPVVNTTIEIVEAGNYCLLDFSTVDENFVNNYLTYEELIRDYSRKYDFYYSYDLVTAETGLLLASISVRVGDSIKLLDDINCYINIYINGMTVFYIVHNRDLLSEELKEKIPYNGIWLISNEPVTPYGGQIRNFWFREYEYAKFDPNLIPDNVMFKRDMGEYVTQEEMDGAIADLHAVQYTEQTLTDEQKAQARTNIDASDFSGDWTDLTNSPMFIDKENSVYTDTIFNPEKNKMIQLADFTNLTSLQSLLIKSLGANNKINRPASANYLYLAFYWKWNDDTHNELKTTINVDSISLIDSKNYSVNNSGTTTDILYMILDLSTLTEEYKTLFPTTGLYFKFTYDTAKYKYYYVRAELQVRNVLRSDWISTEIARVSDIPTQIQADWSQTDETARDYIKNRTHYDTTREYVFSEVVTKNHQIVFNDLKFDPDKFYTVTISNDTEERVINGNFNKYSSSMAGFEGWSIASRSLNPDRHFDLYAENNDLQLIQVCSSITMPATLSIYYSDGTIKQLDEKYIPDTIARTYQIPDVPVIQIITWEDDD